MAVSPAIARAAIITVGNELVTGKVENRNASWLAEQLAGHGLEVAVIVALPDDVRQIGGVVRWAHLEHDVVIVTGGLGVTPDDVTREGVSRGLRAELELDSSLYAELYSQGGHSAAFADEWARLPKGARLLERLPGGAPAFAVDNVYVLAGRPEEMQESFGRLLSELPSGGRTSVWKRTFDVPEDAVVAHLTAFASQWPTLSLGSYPEYSDGAWKTEIVLRGRSVDTVLAAATAIEQTLAGETSS